MTRVENTWRSVDWVAILAKLMLESCSRRLANGHHSTCPRLSNQRVHRQTISHSVLAISVSPGADCGWCNRVAGLPRHHYLGTTVLETHTTLPGGETSSTPGCQSLLRIIPCRN